MSAASAPRATRLGGILLLDLRAAHSEAVYQGLRERDGSETTVPPPPCRFPLLGPRVLRELNTDWLKVPDSEDYIAVSSRWIGRRVRERLFRSSTTRAADTFASGVRILTPTHRRTGWKPG